MNDRPMIGHGPIAAALLDALGLTGRRVTAIEFRCAVNEIVTIKVEEIISVDAVVGVTKALSEYQLIPKPSFALEPPPIECTSMFDSSKRYELPTKIYYGTSDEPPKDAA